MHLVVHNVNYKGVIVSAYSTGFKQRPYSCLWKHILLSLAVMSSGMVFAQTPPDNWGGRNAHIVYSAVLGATLEMSFPRVNPILLGAVCLIPGHLREQRQSHMPGNRYSEKDMISNAVGCSLGIGTAYGIRVLFAPNWVGITIPF